MSGWWAWRALAALFVLGAAAYAQVVQPVPPLTGRVVDAAGLLEASQRDALESKLAAFESQAGPQIVVLLVASTQPEDIAAYAQRVGEAWKIGRRDVGDGLLLVVSRDERRVRIEVAKALEGAVPDLAARQVIDRSIVPAFKKGDFAGGLNAGVDALMARIRGENLSAPTASDRRAGAGDGFDWEELGLFFFVGVPLVGGIATAVLGRKLGSLATAGGSGALIWILTASALLAALGAFAALVLVGVLGIGAAGRRSGSHGGIGGGPPVIWGGGGSGGGGDFGGFSSGGGGDFGGGGASGDW